MLTAIINGPDGEQVSEFDDQSIVLGRNGTLRLNDRRVSKRHARLQSDGDEWFVEDMGSTNGTFINGVRVVRPCRVREGDKLRLGSTQLTISKLSQPERLEAPRVTESEPLPTVVTVPPPELTSQLAPALAFIPPSAPLPDLWMAVSAPDDELGFLTLSANDLQEPVEWTPPDEEVPPVRFNDGPGAIESDSMEAPAQAEAASAEVAQDDAVASRIEAEVTADPLVPEADGAPVESQPAAADDVSADVTADVAMDEGVEGADPEPPSEPELPPSIAIASKIAAADENSEAAAPVEESAAAAEIPSGADDQTPPLTNVVHDHEEPRFEGPAPMMKPGVPPTDEDESLAAFMNVLPAQGRARQQQLTRMPDEAILSIRPFARRDEPAAPPEQPWRRRMPYVMLSLVLLAVLANLALLAMFRRDARRDAAALQSAIEKQDQATAELILQEVREELRAPSAQHVEAWQALGDSVLAKQEALAEKLQAEIASQREAVKPSETPAPAITEAAKAAEESRSAMLRELGEIKLALAELRKSSAPPAPAPAAPVRDEAKPASATEDAAALLQPASPSQRHAEPAAVPVVVSGRKGVHQSFVIDASGALQSAIPEAVAEVRRSIDASRTRGAVRILLLYQGRLIELPPAALVASGSAEPVDLGTADLAAAVKEALGDRPVILNLLSDTLGGVSGVQGVIRQADMSGTSVNVTQFFARAHREQLKSLARDYHGTYGYVAARGQ